MRTDDLVKMTSQELLARLQAAGMTVNAVATATGISQPQLARVAAGTRQLREDAYRKLLTFAVERLVA